MPIYVIGQMNNKYTVILSNEMDEKIVLNKISRELGTLWMIANQPYYVKSFYPEKDEWDYQDMVLKTMARYGVENVRGGPYQERELSVDDKTIVDRHVREIKLKYVVPIQKVVRGHIARSSKRNKNKHQ